MGCNDSMKGAERTEKEIPIPSLNEIRMDAVDDSKKTSKSLKTNVLNEEDDKERTVRVDTMPSSSYGKTRRVSDTQPIDLLGVHHSTDNTRNRLATLFNFSESPILGETSRITRSMFDHKRNVDELIEASSSKHGHLQKKVEPDGISHNSDLSLVGDVYDMMSPFAEGGLASVSSAIDKTLNRLVAVKSLKRDFVNDEEIRRNFVAEACVTAQLDHPSIVPIYSINRDRENGLHLAMKMINGQNFKDYLGQICTHYKIDGVDAFDERKSMAYRIEIFLRVCEAMEYAHSRNVMHCDLKPENIMIGEYHETYVMDWGIARLIREPGFDPTKWVRPKQISGTPRFLSPEAINGEYCDHRADIFTLGLILFEVVTLSPAYTGQSSVEVMSNIKENLMEPIVHKFGFKIDKDLVEIIKKATANHRDERYQTVSEFSEDLRRYQQNLEVSVNRDSIFGKLFRRMASHKTATMLMIFLLLFFAVSGICFSLYDTMNQAVYNRQRDAALSAAYANCTGAGYEIDKQFFKLESIVQSISNEMVFLLNNNQNPPDPNTKFYSSQDFKNEKKSPPTLLYSKAYRTKIDLDNFCYQIPDNVQIPDSQTILNSLYPLRQRFMQAILNSQSNHLFLEKDFIRLKTEIINEGMPIRWIYGTLTNGMQICYPGNAEYDSKYDGRQRPWYSSALEAPNSVFWSEPYADTGEASGIVITCSEAMGNSYGKISGVMALDVSFHNIQKMMMNIGNEKSYIIEKYLLTNKGKIVLSTSPASVSRIANQQAASESAGTLIFPDFPDRQLFFEMRYKKYGVTQRTEGAIEVIYAYSYISSLKWIYVEKIRFEPFLKDVTAEQEAERIKRENSI